MRRTSRQELAALLAAATGMAGMSVVTEAGAADTPPPPSELSAPAVNLAKNALLRPGTCGNPQYPLSSIKRQEQGRSFIRLIVDAKGTVTSSAIIRSSGSMLLDQETLDAFATCRFFPAQNQAGAPVSSIYAKSFEWRLQDAPADPWVDLRALQGTGFAPVADYAALPFAGKSVATAEQRAKMLKAVSDEALEKAQCASIEQVTARIAPPTDDTTNQRSLELWSLKQCGLEMRYVVAVGFPKEGRPWFRMMPLAPSQPSPFAPL